MLLLHYQQQPPPNSNALNSTWTCYVEHRCIESKANELNLPQHLESSPHSQHPYANQCKWTSTSLTNWQSNQWHECRDDLLTILQTQEDEHRSHENRFWICGGLQHIKCNRPDTMTLWKDADICQIWGWLQPQEGALGQKWEAKWREQGWGERGGAWWSLEKLPVPTQPRWESMSATDYASFCFNFRLLPLTLIYIFCSPLWQQANTLMCLKTTPPLLMCLKTG